MEAECDIPFTRASNCTVTLAETYQPFLSYFRLAWMCFTAVIFIRISYFSFYYMMHMRSKENPGPVRKGKTNIWLSAPLMMIFSWIYSYYGFYWTYAAESYEGKVSFIALISIMALSLNIAITQQVMLNESIPFKTSKNNSEGLLMGSAVFQFLVLFVLNPIIWVSNLSFKQCMILVVTVAGVPQVGVAPFNIAVCLEFEALLVKTISADKAKGTDTQNLEALLRKLKQATAMIKGGPFLLLVDLMVLVPLFNTSLIYITFQSTFKVLMISFGCIAITQFFVDGIRKDLRNNETSLMAKTMVNGFNKYDSAKSKVASMSANVSVVPT